MPDAKSGLFCHQCFMVFCFIHKEWYQKWYLAPNSREATTTLCSLCQGEYYDILVNVIFECVREATQPLPHVS